MPKRKSSSARMPRKRRRTNRRLFGRRKRRISSKMGQLTVTRMSNLNTAYNVHFAVMGSDTVPQQALSTTFNLDALAGATEIKNLFDNYRILKVQYRWVILKDPSTNSQTAAASQGIFPQVRWCHDFNDSTPITKNQMMQHSGMREWYFSANRQTSPWYTLAPASLTMLYEGVSTTAYKPAWRQFVDTADSAMPHYGIKFVCDYLYVGQLLQMEAKVTVQAKGIS